VVRAPAEAPRLLYSTNTARKSALDGANLADSQRVFDNDFWPPAIFEILVPMLCVGTYNGRSAFKA
jgi:hypothetical protein